jgi:hypothetical protein
MKCCVVQVVLDLTGPAFKPCHTTGQNRKVKMVKKEEYASSVFTQAAA